MGGGFAWFGRVGGFGMRGVWQFALAPLPGDTWLLPRAFTERELAL